MDAVIGAERKIATLTEPHVSNIMKEVCVVWEGYNLILW